ncbi:hypothetical protein VOLCADRAFT_92590 [Volvox carteri f. nagariensis]|uniref:Uncharacterized protein n=1 Tax=Volvox carteri f. nagariensis TaxID=3068 RepID=D8U018_VOLCA|nr:uncharacterized protein VOLCADRAFT_92590 [Volvox carteri f. nagariensis]EFJ46789.1 hypothetical protein VOLCADRAFT_92590 [Volvox carteri f. nagariensis]|eukprot:XP_002951998.1 hypothetical protein VOLCADRAFT_92590 [Volvox carteri f. nagariensis]
MSGQKHHMHCRLAAKNYCPRSYLIVWPGRIQRLAAALATRAASARFPSLPRERDSERRNYDVPYGHVAFEPQHHFSSAITRTPQVRTDKPVVLGPTHDALGGSHTQPANTGLAAYGWYVTTQSPGSYDQKSTVSFSRYRYRLFGPAYISKHGDCLVARLLPGARLELLGGVDGGGATAVQTASSTTPVATMNREPPAGRTSVRSLSAEEAAAAAAAGLLPTGDGEDGRWDVQCISTTTDAEEDEEGGGGAGDDGAVAECVLVAAYVELGGSASSVDLTDVQLQPAVHHRNGHTYLSVRNLPPSAVIMLSADGDLSHPVKVTPPEPPTAAPAAAGGAATGREG